LKIQKILLKFYKKFVKMSDGQNNRIPNLPDDGASVPETIWRLEEQLLQIWLGNSVQNEMQRKEVLQIKEKVLFLDHTITNMTSIILKQSGTIQKLRLANEKLQSDVKTLVSADKLIHPQLKKTNVELEPKLGQRLPSSSPPSPPPPAPSPLRKVGMADMSNQAEMVNAKVEMFNHPSAKLVEIFNDWKSDEDTDSEEELGPSNTGLPFQLEGSPRLVPAWLVGCSWPEGKTSGMALSQNILDNIFLLSSF